MLKITIYKDELRWASDLRKTVLKLGNIPNVWEEAKKITSHVDAVQIINLSDSFFHKKKDQDIQDDIYCIGSDIARGRNFKASLT